MSDEEICDLTDENNVALKRPYSFQLPIYYTAALVYTYPFQTVATIVGGVIFKNLLQTLNNITSANITKSAMEMIKTRMSDSNVSLLLFASMSHHSGCFECCSKGADKARRWCCSFAFEKVKDTRDSVLGLGQSFQKFFKRTLFK